jgi:FtsH-binding integral membrane protein
LEQTKYDFASFGGYLYGALLAFCLIGLATLFFPFSSTLEALYAGAGVMLFSLLLIYDTQNILRRLSPGEEVFAVISLYLDIIQIFLNILRLLSSDRSDWRVDENRELHPQLNQGRDALVKKFIRFSVFKDVKV